MTNTEIDFKCDCGDPRCGTMRFVLTKTDTDKMVDVCFIPYKKRKPTLGVVVRGRNYDKLVKFLEDK